MINYIRIKVNKQITKALYKEYKINYNLILLLLAFFDIIYF